MCKTRAAATLFILTVLTVFAPAAAHAVQGRLCASLAVNIRDQFQHILPARTPFLPTVDKVRREQPFQLYLILDTPAVKDGNADVTAEISVRSPDGKVRKIAGDLPAIRGKINPAGKIFLAGFTIKQIFDPDDRDGKYLFSGVVKDKVGNSVYTLPEITVELLAEPASLPKTAAEFKTPGELSRFLSFYYRNPQPEKILPAMKGFFRMSDGLRKNNRSGDLTGVLSGFAELMILNPQLWVPMARMSASLATSQRREMAVIINAVGSAMEEKCRPHLDPETIALLDAQSGNNPLLFKSVSTAAQLDVLWARFFISGTPAPLRMIAAQLGRSNITLPADILLKGKDLSSSDREGLKNYLLLSAADWSLSTNIIQHQLAANYFEYMLAGKQISDRTSRILIQKYLLQAERRRAALRKKAAAGSLKKSSVNK